MEEFLLEHGGVIVSGIIAVTSLVILSSIIWVTGRMAMVAFEQILGVCSWVCF